MKYKESLIPKNKKGLLDCINSIMMCAPMRKFLDFEDFDGAFFSLERGVENIRSRFGDTKANQILEMVAEAKHHYEVGDNKLGGALMEDAKMVVMDRQPWAYPKELYRWREDSSLPELSEADLLNRGDKDD